jgi:hypothetical protein
MAQHTSGGNPIKIGTGRLPFLLRSVERIHESRWIRAGLDCLLQPT